MIKAMHYNQFAILSLAELVVTNDTIGIVPFICAAGQVAHVSVFAIPDPTIEPTVGFGARNEIGNTDENTEVPEVADGDEAETPIAEETPETAEPVEDGTATETETEEGVLEKDPEGK